MLSLRLFARAAPKAASRFASSTSLRPALQTALRTPIASQIPRVSPADAAATAAFSTTHRRPDQHGQALAAKLASEISIEKQESDSTSTGSDANIVAFNDENPDWKWTDRAGYQDVFLTRKFDDETITVRFSIADFNSQMMPDEDPDAALHDEEDLDLESVGADAKRPAKQSNNSKKGAPEQDEDAYRDDEEDVDSDEYSVDISVDVLVQRPNKGALRFSLAATDGDFIINQISRLPKETKISSVEELLRSVNDVNYAGPPFHQLDEEVQNLTEQYLHARGVNSALANVIVDYIDAKEQKEYIQWLEQVKAFLD